MAHLTGKWALISSEHFDDYMKAIGVADEQRAKGRESLEKTGAGGLVEEYTILAGDTVKRNIFIGGQMVKESPAIPFGKEVQGPALDGRTCQLQITENSPDKITRHEVFGTVTSDTIYEVHGDELVATLKAAGITATRKYKRV